MNHLEQLVAEWLQYNGYFVRVAVQVGRLPKGGFAGELDVAGINLARNHLLHVECSLDAKRWEEKRRMLSSKFERGRRFMRDVFEGIPIPDKPEQVAVLQVTSVPVREFGGGRAMTVRELIHEINDGLKGKGPMRGAVPTNLPLLRTLQLAADASKVAGTANHLLTPSTTPSKCPN